MSDSEPKYFDGWDGPLLPYSAFHAHYTKGSDWRVREEFIIPRSMHSRFKITIEHADRWDAKDIGRADTLAEHGIYDADEDVKETAKLMMDTIFYNMSEHEYREMMVLMARYCNESEEYRRTHGSPLYEYIDVKFNEYHPKAYEKNIDTTQGSGGQHEGKGQEGSEDAVLPVL